MVAAALLYGCQFCGVRFSSLRTLQGHLTFYCSKKPQLPVQQSEENDCTQNDKAGKICLYSASCKIVKCVLQYSLDKIFEF